MSGVYRDRVFEGRQRLITIEVVSELQCARAVRRVRYRIAARSGFAQIRIEPGPPREAGRQNTICARMVALPQGCAARGRFGSSREFHHQPQPLTTNPITAAREGGERGSVPAVLRHDVIARRERRERRCAVRIAIRRIGSEWPGHGNRHRRPASVEQLRRARRLSLSVGTSTMSARSTEAEIRGGHHLIAGRHHVRRRPPRRSRPVRRRSIREPIPWRRAGRLCLSRATAR